MAEDLVKKVVDQVDSGVKKTVDKIDQGLRKLVGVKGKEKK